MMPPQEGPPMDRCWDPLSRRQFVLGAGAASLGLAAGCGRLPGQAEQPAKPWRVGLLHPTDPQQGQSDSAWAAFHEALAGLGYAEGQNITFERRYAEGRNDRWDEFAADLVRIPVDLIFTPNLPAALATKRATARIPIVLPLGDLVGSGLAESLAHPGRNFTGLTNISVELTGKRLELLKQTIPGLVRVAVFWRPDNPAEVREWQETQAAAGVLGVSLQSVELYAPYDLEGAFEAAVQERAEAVLVRGTAMGSSQFAQTADLARRHRMPVMSDRRVLVEAGALLAYGPNLNEQFRRAASYVDRIFKGAKPADLPIEQPKTFDFIVNLKTAKELGITFPEEIRLQVTEVLQ
jgi:putative tryptophan/tyrosine transport system substrate-binding protein